MDRVQKTRSEMDKVLLKTSNLKQQIQKKKKRLLEMESGEPVHVVDYEQMKIENGQLQKQIENRNAELVHAKQQSAEAVEVGV